MLPCGLIKDAAGEVLQVNGPVPDAVIVTWPPMQAVNGVAGKVGTGTWFTIILLLPVHPFNVVDAVTVHGAVPLNMMEAFSS